MSGPSHVVPTRTCPHCGSTEVHDNSWNDNTIIIVGIAALALIASGVGLAAICCIGSVALPLMAVLGMLPTSVLRCTSCRHRWKL